MIALIGKKIGMTQSFTEKGELLSVTAIEVGPCPILGIKDKNIQIGFDPVNEKRVKKPILGFFNKIKVAPRKVIKEILRDAGREYKIGDELKVDLFKSGDFVDITGVSIGKGFQGGMKRWNWRGGPRSHGSMSHRRVGSIGSSATPSRVLKGKHLPGHMGHQQVTIQNLRVVSVDAQNNLMLVKGAVPGHKNSYMVIKTAKKKAVKVIKEKK
ncbi:MAG: 50S ribosomal protein L3 [Candidatus Omnitrophota bacterium]